MERLTPHSKPWRAVTIALWIITPLLLIAGNAACPEVAGRDFTPFEIAGLAFFVFVVPTTAILAMLRKWVAAGVTQGLFHGAMGGLLLAWLGVLPFLSWILPVAGTAATVAHAFRAKV